MLSLTRRVGEEIVIGDPRQPLGTIRIVDVHGDKVRLSFDFHRDIPINRKELADQKAKQSDPANKPATPPGPPPAPDSPDTTPPGATPK
jgi:carbon storage regulator CsrA